MIVNKENTETILKNMRSEGHSSRADYIELMQQRIAELEHQLDNYNTKNLVWFERHEIKDLDPEQSGVINLNAVRLNTLMDFRHDCGSMNGYHAVDVWDKMDEYIKREFS